MLTRSKMMTHLMLIGVILFVFGVVNPLSSVKADTTACSPAKSAMKVGDSIHKITSGGLERGYLLYVPKTYDPAQQSPLVMSLHGYTSNAVAQAALTNWNAVADKNNFIVVYPQAAETPTRWHIGGIFPDFKIDDIVFIRDLIAQLSSDLCLDPARIFVNGMSNGGGMSNLIACKMADQFAAAGMVSGQYADVRGGCNPARPIPIMAFHGTGDDVVPYNGKKIYFMPPILDWFAEWGKRDGCDAEPKKLDTKGDVSGLQYTGCKADVTVTLYTIDGGGHTWPGSLVVSESGKTSMDINATETLWNFYVAHPLPPPQTK